MAYNWQPGEVITADNLNGKLPQGILGQNSPTDATTTTTAEAFRGAITAPLKAARRYKLEYTGAYQSSAAGDFVIIRLRWKAGATVDSAGTSIQAKTLKCETAGANQDVGMLKTFTVPADGQYTVGVSIIRSLGSGNVKLDFAANAVEPFLLLTDIGAG